MIPRNKLRGIKRTSHDIYPSCHPRMFLSGVQPACALHADRSEFRLDSR
jgi:hypothetical protein